MSNLKIGSDRNVRGLNNKLKRKKLFRQIKNEKYDLFLMQEVYSTEATERLWGADWGGKIYFSHGTNNARGVAIAVGSKSGGTNLEVRSDNAGRFLIITFRIDNIETMVVNVYAPNVDSPEFYVKLFTMMNEITADSYIIGGDFNLVMNTELDSKNRKTNNDKSVKIVKAYMEGMGMVDVFRSSYPDTQRYTCYKKHPIIAARLDMFLMSVGLLNQINDTRTVAATYSDHNIVQSKLELSELV